MSVDAINAAEPQRKSPVGAAIGTGVVLGAAGAGTGYLMSKRPDLEKVFAMPADKFEAATKDAKDEVKTAADTIAEGRNEYAKAGETERATLGSKIMKRAEFINNEEKVKPDNLDALKNKVAEEKGKLDAKKVKVDDADKSYQELTNEVKTKRAEWIKAKKALAGAAEGDAKTEAQTKLNDAKKALDKAIENRKTFKAEVGNYIKAERDLSKARIEKFNSIKGEGEAKALSDALTEASNKFQEVKKTKMTELVGKQEYKDAFAKIQKLFSREHVGKNMGIYGGIAAAVGLIAGYLMGGKKEA